MRLPPAAGNRPPGRFFYCLACPAGATIPVHNLLLLTMNRLAAILPSAQVLVSVDATSKKRVLEEVGLLFESQPGLSRPLITDNPLPRERLGSTGLGHGVAIPHGRVKRLKMPMAAVFQMLHPLRRPPPHQF